MKSKVQKISVLELPPQLQVKVGGVRLGYLLLTSANDGAVEVVGVAQFGRQLQLLRHSGLDEKGGTDALSIEHGEGEVVLHLALVDIDTTIVVACMEIAGCETGLPLTIRPRHVFAQHVAATGGLIVGKGIIPFGLGTPIGRMSIGQSEAAALLVVGNESGLIGIVFLAETQAMTGPTGSARPSPSRASRTATA